MEQFIEGESTREEIKNKLRQNFDGKFLGNGKIECTGLGSDYKCRKAMNMILTI